jgi:hypothetical protein
MVGIFIALFLLILQPFGISDWQTTDKTLKLLGYGLVSFIAPLIVHIIIVYVFQRKYSDQTWKVWHEIVGISVVLMTVAFGNMLYSAYLNMYDISLKGYFGALITTLSIGVFPIAFHVLTKHNRLLKQNMASAAAFTKDLKEKIEHSEPKIVSALPQEGDSPDLRFIAENGKDEIKLEIPQLLFIESTDNYCTIHFNVNGTIKKEMIRSSLKRLEGQINSAFVLRCHRAYIVNLKNVIKTEGNAAGYRMSFEGIGQSIPVSRNYIPAVLEALKSMR